MPVENEPRLAGHRLQAKYCASLKSIAAALQPYPFLREGMDRLEGVATNVVQPFNVAVFGRMKTGKSSLINALIGRKLAITGVEEATATINRLTYADGEQLKIFTVHWKDDVPQSFPMEELQHDWNGTGEEVLNRVSRTSWLDLYSDAPVLRDIHIIDTPGTGSTAQEHEDTAQQFISGQEADALVYVFSPVGRETDEDSLSAFRKGCLPGSSPYSSVAVLHKWDHIYWDNGGNWEDIQAKAERLHDAMRGLVADVLPVSAPLGLIAKCAGHEFWRKVIDVLTSFGTEDELVRTLGRDTKWDKDPEQQSLRHQAMTMGLPWSSFQILLRHLYRNKPESPVQASLRIRELSGMTVFEELLDRQFFKQSAVIRQRQTRARAQKELRHIYDQIDAFLKGQQGDLDMMKRLEGEVSSPDLTAWIERKRFSLMNDCRILKEQWKNIDRLVLQIGNERDRDDHILELIRWLDEVPNFFTSDQRLFLKRILKTLGEQSSGELNLLYDKEAFTSLFKQVAALCALPDNRIRNYAEHLRSCLMQVAATLNGYHHTL